MITVTVLAIVWLVLRRPVGDWVDGLRRDRLHTPRLTKLLDAVPPPERTWKEAYFAGDADLHGKCAWCGGEWTAKHPRGHHRPWNAAITTGPIKMPIAGPGISCRR